MLPSLVSSLLTAVVCHVWIRGVCDRESDGERSRSVSVSTSGGCFAACLASGCQELVLAVAIQLRPASPTILLVGALGSLVGSLLTQWYYSSWAGSGQARLAARDRSASRVLEP